MDSSPDRPSGEEPVKSASDAPEAADASAPDVTAAPAAAEQPAAHEAADQPPPPKPRRGLWLGFATVIAIVGLVLAGLGVGSLIMSRDNSVSALDARLAGVELGLRDLSSRAPSAGDAKALEEVTNRVVKLEADAKAAPQPAASDAALAARIAALETELKTLADSVRGLNRRDEEALAAAREARVRADAGAAEVAELAQKIPGAGAAERSELEALTNRMAALERSAKAVESSNGALRLALAATMLDSAVERGDAFGPWLAAMKAFGAGDAKLVAALEPFAATGVPSAATLARQFSELAPALQKAGAPSGEGVLARLQVNAEKLIRIRRVDEPAGSDVGAIVARAEAKVSRGDMAGAASELAQLPPDVRAPAEAWIKRVQARSAAIDASHRLAADAMSGLGK